MKQWKKLSSKYVHENSWYKVRQDTVIRPDGKTGEYNVVEHPGAVYIVAIDDEKSILLIRQERYTTGIESYETPAGGIEAGEAPLETAKRELKEETGYVAKHWEHLTTIQAAKGITNAMGHVFLATDLENPGPHQQQEEGITDMKFVSFDKVEEMIRNGEMCDAQSIASIYAVKLALD